MKEIIIAISGIILFLIGMTRLSSVVGSLINSRIKEYVKYAVDKPVCGLFTGAGGRYFSIPASSLFSFNL